MVQLIWRHCVFFTLRLWTGLKALPGPDGKLHVCFSDCLELLWVGGCYCTLSSTVLPLLSCTDRPTSHRQRGGSLFLSNVGIPRCYIGGWHVEQGGIRNVRVGVNSLTSVIGVWLRGLVALQDKAAWNDMIPLCEAFWVTDLFSVCDESTVLWLSNFPCLVWGHHDHCFCWNAFTGFELAIYRDKKL